MSEVVDPQQARRDQGPLTERGVQRREALLSAARRVFETKGFVDARVSDIVREAKVSQGTFYTYFDTKEAVFAAVARGVVDAMLLLMAPPVPDTDFHDRITDSVRRFLHAYRPHARMIGLIEQVGTFSPEMRDLRLDLRETFVRRTERGIVRLVDAGVTRADIDVEYTAEVLGAMLEYTCYVWFSLGREFDEERLVTTLSDIWKQALAPTVD
ncbi:TetR/AcrR family transcriptional regulator [Nocardioides sp. LHD-245]|uniref:TetR/AcrR family transcriptional regulator n=1 Tax=Nocardioides sp. LHD-245 TaxID=3051387 RepID=UPI0027DFBF87|nr:TetR/AcrR family transcriptional regulator [Nocardioides sp. LHD-245]